MEQPRKKKGIISLPNDVLYGITEYLPYEMRPITRFTSKFFSSIDVDKKIDMTKMCHYFCRYGYLDLLKWFTKSIRYASYNFGDYQKITWAAGGGYLDVVNWIGSPWNHWAVRGAVENGHLAVLKWFRDKDPYGKKCLWDFRRFNWVPRKEYTDEFTWFNDPDTGNGVCPWDKWAVEWAAKYGHLHIIVWLRSQDPTCHWDRWAIGWAAEYGHLNVIKWLRAQRPSCRWDKWAIEWAVKNGHLEVIKRLGNPKTGEGACPCDEWAIALAAKGGHLDVVEWFRANGAPE